MENDAPALPHLPLLYMERREPTKNMARFYALSIERTLFGGLALSRRFGRIGTLGRVLHEDVATEEEALRRLEWLSAWKRRRGYRPPLDCAPGDEG